MQSINAIRDHGAKVKIISNLYYPGYDADNVQTLLHGRDDRPDGEHAGRRSCRSWRA